MVDRRTLTRALGLGFIPDDARHGFVLHLPTSQARTAEVMVAEYRDFAITGDTIRSAPATHADPSVRVILRRAQWDLIADAFWQDAARRLRGAGIEAARLPKRGDVPIHPSIGKELCLLAWAIEDADSAVVPEAIRNWEALAPAERWWLFTMTVASTGQALQRNVGWRKAVRFALTENPLVPKGEGLAPRSRRALLGDTAQMALL
jgi:hypothetical protein